MAKARVPQYGKPQGYVVVDTEATKGAVVGQNLYNADGSLYEPPAAAAPSNTGSVAVTLWELIQKVPEAVRALAAVTGTGLFAITGAGTGATRALQSTVGRTTVSNGDGVAGDPTVDLAVVPDAGAGTALKKILRDAYGRVSATEDAALADVSDVDAAAPSNGNTLLFDSATQKWKAQPLPAGLGWTALGSYDFAVDGALATKDFTDLDGYQDFMILGRGITTASSTDINVRVSIDNGASFYSTLGDYMSLNSSSVEAGSTVICSSGSGTTSAKSPSLFIYGNTAGEYPLGRSVGPNIDRRFVASAVGINALRIGAGSGNMTGGKFTLYGR